MWTPVATNDTDGAGNVNLVLTNALAGGQGQSFYRVDLR